MAPNIHSENTFDDSHATSGYVSTWEPAVAQKIQSHLEMRSANSGQPYMIALVGIPGGGKSVSSLLLANILEQESNDYDEDSNVEVTIMPHDGYHIKLDDLKQMPNAEDMIYRRGAPDTFDPAALKRDLERIRFGQENLITVPGFDHGQGDPQPDQHAFNRRRHKVVICEGLYLLHDSDGWEDIASLFDLKIFIDSDVDACVERLKVRNLCIPGYTPEEIQIRCEIVDRKNAMTVMKSKYRADEVVQSLASGKSSAPPSLAGVRKTASFASLDLTMTHQHTVDPEIFEQVPRKTMSFASLDLSAGQPQLRSSLRVF